MTKTTTPKAPRLTKAQKAEAIALGNKLAVTEPCDRLAVVQEFIDMPALTSETILERAEIAQHNADLEAKLQAPVVPEVDELYVPVKKAMKVVKTVKTGVGAQILQHIADGVLSNKEIVAKVLEDNPLRKTTYACVAWYQSQVKAGKIDLPEAQEEVMLTEEELAEQDQDQDQE